MTRIVASVIVVLVVAGGCKDDAPAPAATPVVGCPPGPLVTNGPCVSFVIPTATAWLQMMTKETGELIAWIDTELPGFAEPLDELDRLGAVKGGAALRNRLGTDHALDDVTAMLAAAQAQLRINRQVLMDVRARYATLIAALDMPADRPRGTGEALRATMGTELRAASAALEAQAAPTIEKLERPWERLNERAEQLSAACPPGMTDLAVACSRFAVAVRQRVGPMMMLGGWTSTFEVQPHEPLDELLDPATRRALDDARARVDAAFAAASPPP